MDEGTAAYRHWHDLMSFSRGKDAELDGIEYLQARIAEGWVFDSASVDLADHVHEYAEFGLAAPLRRLWPRFKELVSGNTVMARRMAELGEQLHIGEVDASAFAAGVRRFADESCIVQIDTGLLLTIFEVVQLFVHVSLPNPEAPTEEAEREAAVMLELLRAEYRLVGGNATPKAMLPTPTQGHAIGELAQSANVFVLAHEVSHLLLAHSGDRDDDQRQQDEVAADVLALHIVAGVYAADHTISRPQAYGRLLGARLLFTCVELVEHAAFVTMRQTHPPAADRWAVLRAASEQIFGPPVPDGVDGLWRPMERLLASSRLGLAQVERTMASLKIRERFVGTAADTSSAVELIRLFRRTETRIGDREEQSGGAAFAMVAQSEMGDRTAISWSGLLRLRARRGDATAEQCVTDTTVAARILSTTRSCR